MRGLTEAAGVAWVVALFVVWLGATAGLGCRRGVPVGVPVVDTGEDPSSVDGTISGRLTGISDSTRLSGRRVEAINVETGARVDVSTTSTGGFTLKVPPGKYRLNVELRDGESLATPLETIDINRSDLDANIEIAVTAAVARPRRSDSLRSVDGLGSPVA